MFRRLTALTLLLAFSLLATGCGDSNKPKGDPSKPPPKGGPQSKGDDGKGVVAPPPPELK